jgi:hypothetical protein
VPIITGIELRPDSCVLARARPVPGGTEISALHVIERAAWPAHPAGVAAALREVRRRKGMPRAASVVLWALDEPATPNDAHVRPLIKPILAAGFRVASVLTPAQALAALWQTRPRTHGSGVAWLALNTHGAAIAIVRDGELLFSRAFEWSYATQVGSPRGEMLQRYTLVAHLAPELKRGIAFVRQAYGVTVDTAVTCGDLPDLRSLTMPLIEELDLEVETLDSTEGLVSTGSARNDRFAESAPSLRLAAAAATARTGAAGKRAMWWPLARAAAAALVIGTPAFVGYRVWSAQPAQPATTRVVSNLAPRRPQPQATPVAAAKTPVTVAPPVTTPPVAAPVTTTPLVPAPSPSTTAAPIKPVVTAAPKTAPLPPQDTAPKPVPPPPIQPAVEKVEKKSVTVVEPPARKPVAAPVQKPVDVPPPVQEVRPPAPRAEGVAGNSAPVASVKRLVPLRDPLPTVESILVSRDRRLAVVGGSIVKVGDTVGPRVVVQIESAAVVLREPSGYEIRIALRVANEN